MTDSLSIAILAFASRVLMSASVDETTYIYIRFVREEFVGIFLFKQVVRAHLFTHAFKYSYQTLIILFDINHLFAQC